MTVGRATAERNFRRLTIASALLAGAAALLISLGGATTASAAMVTFGSPLSVEATLNTAKNLDYKGTCTPYGTGCVPIAHDGADTVLWNVEIPGEAPAAPGSGEVKSIKLEGCAEQPKGAPEPLTQIHFQDLRPKSDGSYSVEGTSAPFNIPVCGKNGASGATITTYSLENLCVLQGDYLDFNDEGGFEPTYYPSGVPYKVIGSVQGATMDSFIKDSGTGNGSVLSPQEVGQTNGFASNAKEELLLQATVDTAGSYFCKGSEPPPPSEKKSSEKSSSEKGSGKAATPPKKVETVRLLKKSARVAKGAVRVSVSCSGNTPCSGTLVLKAKTAGKGGMFELGHAKLRMADGSKHVYFVRLTKLGRKRMRVAKGRVKVTITVRSASGEPSSVGTLLVRK